MLLRLNPTDCTTICKLCSPYITNTRCAVLCCAVLYCIQGQGWAGQELMVVRWKKKTVKNSIIWFEGRQLWLFKRRCTGNSVGTGWAPRWDRRGREPRRKLRWESCPRKVSLAGPQRGHQHLLQFRWPYRRLDHCSDGGLNTMSDRRSRKGKGKVGVISVTEARKEGFGLPKSAAKACWQMSISGKTGIFGFSIDGGDCD